MYLELEEKSKDTKTVNFEKQLHGSYKLMTKK